MRLGIIMGAIAVAAIALGAVVLIATQPLPDVNPPGRTNASGEAAQGFADVTVHLTISRPMFLGAPLGLTLDAHRVAIKETLGNATGPVTATIWPSLTVSQQCTARVKMFWADSSDSGNAVSREFDFSPGAEFTVPFGHLYLFPGAVTLTFEASGKGCGLELYTDFLTVGSTWQHGFNFDGVNST